MEEEREMEMRRSRRDDENNIARGDGVAATSSLLLVPTRPTAETTGPAASWGAGASAL